MKIKKIVKNSIAEKYNLEKSFDLLSINNNLIENALDLTYFSLDDKLTLKIKDKNGKILTKDVTKEINEPLGIELEDYVCKECINNCVFCFVHQMAPKMRKTLYVKDDDYIYSFYHGNYITLTNLKDSDFARIYRQTLSPLYISVHATNKDLRKKMMRYDSDFDILKKLHELSDNNIQLHTQIVVVPGFNDGERLRETLNDLTDENLNILSIGIVPVGLTKYRENLPDLKPFTKEKAIETLKIANEFSEKLDENKVFCSDEIFITAQQDFPEIEYYSDFPQLENGIGMTKTATENWLTGKEDFIPIFEESEERFVFITGKINEKLINSITDEINKTVGKKIARTKVIKNKFWGENITVTGLLTFGDIKEQVSLEKDEYPVLSSTIFNMDGLTLDNFSKEDIMNHFNKNIVICDELFEELEIL